MSELSQIQRTYLLLMIHQGYHIVDHPTYGLVLSRYQRPRMTDSEVNHQSFDSLLRRNLIYRNLDDIGTRVYRITDAGREALKDE